MPEKQDISDRLLKMSSNVIRLLDELPATMPAKKIADQLVRSTMSVGANFEESQAAQGRTDFCHKLQIALKEMRETRYWLCLLESSGIMATTRMASLIQEASELRAILGKCVATTRRKLPD